MAKVKTLWDRITLAVAWGLLAAEIGFFAWVIVTGTARTHRCEAKHGVWTDRGCFDPHAEIAVDSTATRRPTSNHSVPEGDAP